MNYLVSKLNGVVQDCKDKGLSVSRTEIALKEFLQYVVLHYIYNSKKYSDLVMYGGSLLRICYGLNRMSEDLDFQSSKEIDLDDFQNDLIGYFKNDFDFDLLVSSKGNRTNDIDLLYLRFDLLDQLDLDTSRKVLKLRIDINHFPKTERFSKQLIPILKDNYVFSVRTYSFPVLMASKINAVLSRTERGIGENKLSCKPRDLYDLIWYMNKNTVPDMAYLKEQGVKIKNVYDLMDELDERVKKINDEFFKLDLAPFFNSDYEFNDWYRNWKERFFILKQNYKKYKLSRNPKIVIYYDDRTTMSFFRFYFKDSLRGDDVLIEFRLGRSWLRFKDLKIKNQNKKKDLIRDIEFQNIKKLKSLYYDYTFFFLELIQDYLERNDLTVYQQEIKTKLITIPGSTPNRDHIVFTGIESLKKIKLEDLF